MEKGVKIIFIIFNVFLNLIICVPVHNNTCVSVYKLRHQTMLLYLNFSKGQSSAHIHHETYVGQGLVLNWLDQQKLCQLIFLHSIEENIYKGQDLL